MANPFHTPQHKQVSAPSRDFRFSDFGSVCLLTPLTSAAREWCDDYLPPDRLTLGYGIAIQPRAVEAIVNAINEAGLTGEVV